MMQCSVSALHAMWDSDKTREVVPVITESNVISVINHPLNLVGVDETLHRQIFSPFRLFASHRLALLLVISAMLNQPGK